MRKQKFSRQVPRKSKRGKDQQMLMQKHSHAPLHNGSIGMAVRMRLCSQPQSHQQSLKSGEAQALQKQSRLFLPSIRWNLRLWTLMFLLEFVDVRRTSSRNTVTPYGSMVKARQHQKTLMVHGPKQRTKLASMPKAFRLAATLTNWD